MTEPAPAPARTTPRLADDTECSSWVWHACACPRQCDPDPTEAPMPEPPAPRPQDVPDELLDVAWRAELARRSPGASAEQIEEYCDFAAHPSMASHREELRPVVGAVLAAHERMVREQAARELHDRAAAYADILTGPRASFRRGMEAAARHIAPPPTPGEIADAIRRGDAVVCDLYEEDE